MTDFPISRAVPLDQLRDPETDVRQRRTQEDVQSLAASMGDPGVGQLQAVLTHPVEDSEAFGAEDPDLVDEHLQDDGALRIVDGKTRELAANYLGWATLDCMVYPEPPENTVVAQLDANTERIEMTSFETVRALYQHKQETGATLSEMGEKVGYSVSHLSNLFGCLELPEVVVDAWRHPDHPIEAGHARAIKSYFTDTTLQRYMDAAGCDRETAHDHALKDARMMVDVAEQHDPPLQDFRNRAKRCLRDTLDGLKAGGGSGDPQADGATQAARQRETTPHQPPEATAPCLVCGDDHDRRKAIPVCGQDYGMLADMEERGEVLLSQADQNTTAPEDPVEADAAAEQVADAVAKVTGVEPRKARSLLRELQQQSSEAGAD